MQDKTIIRLTELACGGFALFLHAYYGINSLLLVLICVLWGIPLDVVMNRAQKKDE